MSTRLYSLLKSSILGVSNAPIKPFVVVRVLAPGVINNLLLSTFMGLLDAF